MSERGEIERAMEWLTSMLSAGRIKVWQLTEENTWSFETNTGEIWHGATALELLLAAYRDIEISDTEAADCLEAIREEPNDFTCAVGVTFTKDSRYGKVLDRAIEKLREKPTEETLRDADNCCWVALNKMGFPGLKPGARRTCPTCGKVWLWTMPGWKRCPEWKPSDEGEAGS